MAARWYTTLYSLRLGLVFVAPEVNSAARFARFAANDPDCTESGPRSGSDDEIWKQQRPSDHRRRLPVCSS
jgi:hypothetical protein